MQRLEVSGTVLPLNGPLGIKGLKWVFKKQTVVDWICLVQDRVQWRVLENVEMNLHIL